MIRRVVVTLALAAGALSAVAPPAQAALPVPGTCLDYTEDQWSQTAFTAVTFDCATEHNGEVLGSVTLPADISAAAYGSAQARGWAFRACQSVAVDYVWTRSGTRYPKSSYVMPRTARLYAQLPTAEEWAQGQRWAVCLGQSRNTALNEPDPRTGSVQGGGLKPYVCMNPRGWGGMQCAKRDAVRLTNQVWIPKSYTATYPGTKRMLKLTRTACEKARVRGWTLRTWFVPGQDSWDRGNRYGFCEFVK